MQGYLATNTAGSQSSSKQDPELCSSMIHLAIIPIIREHRHNQHVARLNSGTRTLHNSKFGNVLTTNEHNQKQKQQSNK